MHIVYCVAFMVLDTPPDPVEKNEEIDQSLLASKLNQLCLLPTTKCTCKYNILNEPYKDRQFFNFIASVEFTISSFSSI